MFCQNCGSRIPEHGKFCGQCGAAVAQAPMPIPSQAQPSSFLKEGQDGRRRGSRKALAIVGTAAAVLLLAVLICISLGGRGSVVREDAAEPEAADRDVGEQLCGTWSDAQGMLTLTFQRDGTLRIAGGDNLFGADLMKYQVLDDDTLGLSANQGGLLGLVSVNMKYELSGERLTVELGGQEFVLTRQ